MERERVKVIVQHWCACSWQSQKDLLQQFERLHGKNYSFQKWSEFLNDKIDRGDRTLKATWFNYRENWLLPAPGSMDS